ncbi:MAG TPA: TIGR01777 family oxidoreductase [Verrucomicrobiae bacterium]|nr:TIGR01777 family oxidoreductase [Verrucomicrobiae bacterium]
MKTNRPKIILAGGSGFIGQILARCFNERNFEVIVLTRSPKANRCAIREIEWDGKTLGAWTAELENARAVVNLAGRSVNCRYHARNRRVLMESRLEPTRVLGDAIARCECPPRVWLNASTATIYKHSLDRTMDEAGEIGATPAAKDAFSIELAVAWEKMFNETRTRGTRKILLRTAMVLGPGKNSVFPALRRLARLGLGGKMASGRQFVSWIHEEDFRRAIQWLIEREDFSGAVNVAAPNPIPNREVMRIFRRVCGLPFGLPAPLWLLEIGAFFLRTETELIIKSRRVVPRRLEAAGFMFRFREMEDAVREIESRMGE